IFSLPFHARSTSLRFASCAAFPSCGDGSIAATPPLRSSKNKFRKLHLFFCGAWGCLIAPHQSDLTTISGTLNEKKNK
ncbi:MAG TPA: hypothetical protein VGB71_05285, partial [Flavisolibacter sp.]